MIAATAVSRNFAVANSGPEKLPEDSWSAGA
jgi:hypothetical protein